MDLITDVPEERQRHIELLAYMLVSSLDAFEGAAVMADTPRSALCVRSRPDALGALAAKSLFSFQAIATVSGKSRW
jgi:hypothetical protein